MVWTNVPRRPAELHGPERKVDHAFALFGSPVFVMPCSFDEHLMIDAREGGYDLVLLEGRQGLLLAYIIGLP